jgi:diguanylate cyclase (GGDEF)-like protein
MAAPAVPLKLLQTFLRFQPDPLNEKFLVKETGIPARTLKRLLARLTETKLVDAHKREGVLFYHLTAPPDGPAMLNLVTEFLEEEVRMAEARSKLDLEHRMLLQQVEQKEQEAYKASSRFVTYLNSLVFLEEISSIILRSQSFDEVFQETFRRLSSAVNYDLGVAALLEDKLNLHVIHKAGIPQERVQEALASARDMMGIGLALPYLLKEYAVVQKVEEKEHAPASSGLFRHRLGAPFQKDPMTPGYLVLFRLEDTPFLADEKQVLDVLAPQIALACQNIAAMQKIQQLAVTDDLTGIFNKRYFRQAFLKEFDRAKRYHFPLSLLMIDLDHFKKINDRYGHPFGDVVLSEFAGLVLELTRSTDIFARYGGEEFALILPHTSDTEALEIAERIRRKVELNAFPGEDHPITITISIGVGTNRAGIETPEDLMNLADVNLYRAKSGGRNLVISG